MMRFLVLVASIIIGALAAGIYGALYDQLTFTISPEFFTKYRFVLSQFQSAGSMNPRIGAAMVGFMNTWKAGFVIGGILSFAGLITSNYKRMFIFTMKAFIMTLAIAFVAGLVGWSVGPLPGQANPDVTLNVIDVNAFKTVENMNNFSYAGGVVGLLIGLFYQVYKHKKFKTVTSSE